MTNKKVLPDGPRKRFHAAFDYLHSFQVGAGFWALLLLLGVVSFLVTYEWGPAPRTYVTGEIAESDIAATRSFTVQDAEATKARRDAVEKAQPLVTSLSYEPVEDMHKRMQEMIIAVNQATDQEELNALRTQVSDELGTDITPAQFMLLTSPSVQNLLNSNLLPWLEQRMREGVVNNVQELAKSSGGVIVRNISDGSEVLRTDIPGLRDIMLDLSLYIRGVKASAQVKGLLNTLLSNQIVATISVNYEATAQRAQEVARYVQPVVHDIKAGEVIVRQGEKIRPEHLVIMQAMWKRNVERFSPGMFFGVWLVSILIISGLFFSPSGRNMTVVQQKELLFIGVMTLCMALLAKAFYMFGFMLVDMSPNITPGMQVYALPLAGAAGLAALSFTSRRNYISSMLMAFFCTIIAKGGISVFLFYFMSCILSTWLITDSQSRKQVVSAVLPLAVGMLAVWMGCTLLTGGEPHRFLSEALAVLLGAFLSLVLVFAISPIIEIVFGFTTRFVLMELMNQEHPALRQLMLNAPGTYHHSIVVANMVELAAKAIGAHSLLCKVGAIYHDIGKTEKAQYFIENQFRGVNPHDSLTPTMSALILISHVKRGTELAQQYKLGKEITDIIRQHHGSSAIRYFYNKALTENKDTTVRIEDFSYAGPRPQTREAALIMLADVVEASSRTLADPTPSRIKAHVHNILRSILSEGQLDGADLTFRDLNLVEESFTLILTGIFHKRIEYPDKDKVKAAAKAQEANKAQDAAKPQALSAESSGTAGISNAQLANVGDKAAAANGKNESKIAANGQTGNTPSAAKGQPQQKEQPGKETQAKASAANAGADKVSTTKATPSKLESDKALQDTVAKNASGDGASSLPSEAVKEAVSQMGAGVSRDKNNKPEQKAAPDMPDDEHDVSRWIQSSEAEERAKAPAKPVEAKHYMQTLALNQNDPSEQDESAEADITAAGETDEVSKSNRSKN